MIDVHSHVLPFVDDGSKSLNASLEMIRTAIEFGVTDLFLTPHYMRLRNYVSTYEQNKRVLVEFEEELKKSNLSIRLHLGNEIYYTIDAIKQLREGLITTMGDSRFVLVEFSMDQPEEDLPDAISNLKAAGYLPIIAHPERYDYIRTQKDFELLKRMGAYTQINASSITGKYGTSVQKFVLKMIKQNLIDFVASDIHEFRKNDLSKAYELVTKKFGKSKADQIFHNTTILERHWDYSVFF